MQDLGHLHEELGLLRLVYRLGLQAFMLALHEEASDHDVGVLLAVAASEEVLVSQLEIGIGGVALKFPNCMRNLKRLDAKETHLLPIVVELVRVEPESVPVVAILELVDAGPDHDDEVQHEEDADDPLDSNSESLAPYANINMNFGGLTVVFSAAITENNRNKVVRPLLEETELGISEDLVVQRAVEGSQKVAVVHGDTESNYLVVQDAPMGSGVPGVPGGVYEPAVVLVDQVMN